MRYRPRVYEPRWFPVKNRTAFPEFALKIGEEVSIKVKPTRRATALLLTAAAVLILGAAIYEAVV